ncbi:MAG: hypothetical protein ABIF77_02250 [bacterium]
MDCLDQVQATRVSLDHQLRQTMASVPWPGRVSPSDLRSAGSMMHHCREAGARQEGGSGNLGDALVLRRTAQVQRLARHWLSVWQVQQAAVDGDELRSGSDPAVVSCQLL